MRTWISAVTMMAAVAACGSRDRAATDTTPAAAAVRAEPSLITDVRAVTLPAYESDRGITRASSKAEYEEAVADTRFVLEEFRYPSDGLSVGAYLYRPTNPGTARYPVVIFNRGGYIRQDFGPESLTQLRHLAVAGFVVVAPFIRGSNGTEGRDEMGGADVNDVVNLLPVLRQARYIDTDRLFLYGVSRGAMMTFQLLRDGFPARAAAVYGSWGDLEFLIGPNGSQRDIAAKVWPDVEQRRAGIVERRSALRWIDRLNVPILQLHGANDEGIPVAEARRIEAALAGAGKTHEFRVFEGAGHSMDQVAAERDAAAIAWFQRFDRR